MNLQSAPQLPLHRAQRAKQYDLQDRFLVMQQVRRIFKIVLLTPLLVSAFGIVALGALCLPATHFRQAP